jgi:hypothetical protein
LKLSSSNSQFSFAQGNARDKISVDADREKKRLAVTFEMDEGWHVNNNPASLDHLIPISLSADTSLASLSSVEYPKGERMTFKFSDQSLSVCEGLTTIAAGLHPRTDNLETVDVKFRYQACNDRKCLPPDTITKSVAVQNS